LHLSGLYRLRAVPPPLRTFIPAFFEAILISPASGRPFSTLPHRGHPFQRLLPPPVFFFHPLISGPPHAEFPLPYPPTPGAALLCYRFRPVFTCCGFPAPKWSGAWFLCPPRRPCSPIVPRLTKLFAAAFPNSPMARGTEFRKGLLISKRICFCFSWLYVPPEPDPGHLCTQHARPHRWGARFLRSLGVCIPLTASPCIRSRMSVLDFFFFFFLSVSDSPSGTPNSFSPWLAFRRIPPHWHHLWRDSFFLFASGTGGLRRRSDTFFFYPSLLCLEPAFPWRPFNFSLCSLSPELVSNVRMSIVFSPTLSSLLLGAARDPSQRLTFRSLLGVL